MIKLKMGVDQPSPTPKEEKERIKQLKETVEHYLPEFAEEAKKGVHVFVHQDGFASGYHHDEYILLGLAIKYAGLYGSMVTIAGKNHETF